MNPRPRLFRGIESTENQRLLCYSPEGERSPHPGSGWPARPAEVRGLRNRAAIVAIGLVLSASAALGQQDVAAPAQPADAQAATPRSGPPPEGVSAGTPSAAPPGEPPPETAGPPPTVPLLSLDNVVERVDRTHESVAERLNKTVEWFDSFFSDKRFLEGEYPDSFFRLRTGVRYRQRDGATFLARVHASLVMPGTKERFRVILEGIEEPEQTGVLPGDPTTAEFQTTQDEQGSLQALYELIKQYDINVSVRGGARFHFPIDPFLKLRVRYLRPLGTKSLIRLTEEGFVTVQEGFGETTRVDLERQLAAWTVLRWSTSGTLAEVNPGYVWGSELSLFRQFTPSTAVTVEGGVSAQVQPIAVATNYVARVRFRQNVFRPWFFYEVEPELSWPRDALGAYRPTWGITLLVELQFGKRREAAPDGLMRQ